MSNPLRQMRKALKKARHELATLHGLTARDGAGTPETWTIDTSAVLAQIDAAMAAEKLMKSKTPQPRRSQIRRTGTQAVKDFIVTPAGRALIQQVVAPRDKAILRTP